VSRWFGIVLVFLLSTPLRGQDLTSLRQHPLVVERLATLAVRDFPTSGYVVIRGAADWQQFHDKYVRQRGLDPEVVSVDFSRGPVLGVITTASGCSPGALVQKLERASDTLHVILHWVPNQWGSCQEVQHGGELVQLRSNPREILFFHVTSSDSLERVTIHQVKLR
jgi:hypothetical protein